MNDDPLYERLRETSWRRKLTATEEARLAEWLAAHPEAQDEWDLEGSLTEALARLPNAPVASNFTARVLAAAQFEAAGTPRGAGHSLRPAAWWIRWLPRSALAAVVLGAGLVSYSHIQAARRAEWALSLTTLSQVPSLPSPEVLKDFDAIAALSPAPPADEELLKLMQ